MIKKSLSVYLDVLRFVAAFIVLLSHFAYPRYTNGRYLFIRELNLGSDAVVVFFVLSGMVITFTGTTKDKSLGRFAFNRATRLISVAVPAVLLTFALDRVGSVINTDAYAGWWYNPLSFGRMLFSGLTFSSEWLGQGVRLGTNGPYWSLSYEVAYYVLFGFGLYLRGPLRAALLMVSIVLFGFNTLILLPAWLIGIWVFKQIQNPTPLPAARALALAIVPMLLYVVMLALDVPGSLKQLTIDGTSDGFVRALRFSDEFLWNWLIAGCFALHLIGMASWLGDREFGGVTFERSVRWLAGGSFSLYLVHYPVVQFFSPLLPKTNVWFIDDVILLSITVVICFLFAEAFERRLKPFRALVRRVFGQPELARSSSPQPQGVA